MLQTSNLKLTFLFFSITLLSSCGLRKSANKTTSEVENVEITEKAELIEAPKTPKLVIPSVVEMNTTMGKITLKLYNETTLHKENFAKLIAENYYDDVLFHRVIKDFMVQGGDPNSKDAPTGTPLGNGGPTYTIPAEFNQTCFHKKGALCAARQGDNVNPEQRSSGSQFYFVTGAVYAEEDLKQMEDRINQQAKSSLTRKYWADPKNKAKADLYARYNSENKRDSLNLLQTEVMKIQLENYIPYQFSDAQKTAYTTIGGTPFLDNNYTVFGEVIKGLDVVDEIGRVETAPGDRPLEDVRIIGIKIIE